MSGAASYFRTVCYSTFRTYGAYGTRDVLCLWRTEEAQISEPIEYGSPVLLAARIQVPFCFPTRRRGEISGGE